jgi:hypothetical protein
MTAHNCFESIDVTSDRSLQHRKGHGRICTSRGSALDFSIAALALTLAISTSTAHATTWTANPARSVGNSNAGASINFPLQASNDGGCKMVKIGTRGSATLFGKTATLVEIEALARSCSNGARATYVKAKVAGFTVASDSSTVSFTWSRNLTRTLLSASTTVWVGPVPVTIRGSLAATLSGSLWLGVSIDSAEIRGTLSVSAKGTASAGVGVWGYSVGLEVVLDLLRTKLSSNVKISNAEMMYWWDILGTAWLCFDPVKISLYVKVQAWPFSWSKNLASYSAPTYCVPVF